MRHPPTASLHRLPGLLAAALLLLAAGCMSGREDESVFVFRAYRLADPAVVGGRLSRQIVDHEGTRVVWVHAIPLVSSENVVAAEVVERDGSRAVRLKLDHFGQNLWLQACKQLAGEDMAITVDGFLLFTTPVPRQKTAYDSMLVQGPWDRAQAQGVAAQASDNYRISNPEPGLQPF